MTLPPNGSRIQPRVAPLKPLSSAISIGSGRPFGAEGPIIMTGRRFRIARCPVAPSDQRRAQDTARRERVLHVRSLFSVRPR
jgi:hypothetical protein